MKEMTNKAVQEAFAGESKAHMKYLIYSKIARDEGYDNIARLFEAVAFAERVHATNHARKLSLDGDTVENLQDAVDGETFEVEEMYPAYFEIADMQDEAGAKQSIHYALEAEKIHKDLYNKAQDAAQEDEDIELDEIYICPVCGYTHTEGNLPDKCPVCNTPGEQFKEF